MTWSFYGAHTSYIAVRRRSVCLLRSEETKQTCCTMRRSLMRVCDPRKLFNKRQRSAIPESGITHCHRACTPIRCTIEYCYAVLCEFGLYIEATYSQRPWVNGRWSVVESGRLDQYQSGYRLSNFSGFQREWFPNMWTATLHIT